MFRPHYQNFIPHMLCSSYEVHYFSCPLPCTSLSYDYQAQFNASLHHRQCVLLYLLTCCFEGSAPDPLHTDMTPQKHINS